MRRNLYTYIIYIYTLCDMLCIHYIIFFLRAQLLYFQDCAAQSFVGGARAHAYFSASEPAYLCFVSKSGRIEMRGGPRGSAPTSICVMLSLLGLSSNLIALRNAFGCMMLWNFAGILIRTASALCV